MKTKNLALAILAAAALSISGCAVDEPGTAADRAVAADSTATQVDKPKSDLTASQQNAVETAESYLDTSAFSRKGLIDQLVFEGFSAKDAKFAVDHIDPNWNNQAVLAAKSYLDSGSFSRSGLIEQLEFEGYTHAQAVYGVDKAYR